MSRARRRRARGARERRDPQATRRALLVGGHAALRRARLRRRPDRRGGGRGRRQQGADQLSLRRQARALPRDPDRAASPRWPERPEGGRGGRRRRRAARCAACSRPSRTSASAAGSSRRCSCARCSRAASSPRCCRTSPRSSASPGAWRCAACASGVFRRVDPVAMHLALFGSLVFFLATEPAREHAVAAGRVPRCPTFPEFLRYLEELTLRGLRPDRRDSRPEIAVAAKERAHESTSLAVPIAVVAAILAAAERRLPQGHGPAVIVASGHVEATEVRVSTKVAGTLLQLAVDEGAARHRRPGARAHRHDRHRARARERARRARPGRRRAAAAARRLARGGRARGRGPGRRAPRPTSTGAARDLERMEGLLASGSGTTQARDDARTRRDVAPREPRRGARAAARGCKAGYRPEEIDAAAAHVQAADARIAQLEQQLKDAVIASPIAGVVTEKLAEQGELLARGSGDRGGDRPRATPGSTSTSRSPTSARIRLGQAATVRDRRRPDAARAASRSSRRRPSSRPRTSRRATSA